MKVKLLPLLLLVACRSEKLVEAPVCDTPCYEGAPFKTMNVGMCTPGHWLCDSDGGQTCVGSVIPSYEICDGKDNNCDGKVDNGITEFTDAKGLTYGGDPHACASSCGVGIQRCEHGAWGACTAPQPTPEICDGKDNDCDGLVDEVEDLPVSFCYTGLPASSVSYGICRPGVTRCVAGKEICFGEQTPIPELCNGLDDNCNGSIDDGSSNNDDVDFVVVFDNSASMDMVAATLKAATQSWVTKYANRAGFRYALVAAPDVDQYRYGNSPHLVSDFSSAGIFNAAMALQDGISGSGEEPTIDALMEILDVSNPLGLTWKAGAKRMVFLFSDEEPQSYFVPKSTVADLVRALTGSGTTLEVFTTIITGQSLFDWQQLANAGNGQVWDINADQPTLENNLDNIIKFVSCNQQ